jgi:hypothetical protein
MYKASKEQTDAFNLYETVLNIELCGFYAIFIDNFGLNMLATITEPFSRRDIRP